MRVIIKTIALLVSFHLQLSAGANCPPAEAIRPCSCLPFISQITCWNIKPGVNLTKVFTQFRSLRKNRENNLFYDEFKLIDSELTEFGKESEYVDDFFDGIVFNKISITKNLKLKRIHKKAFKSSFKRASILMISENPILANDPPNEREIFDFLNSFESLTEISVTDNNISVIPDKAFNRQMDSLQRLSFIDNNIVSIGGEAFHSLPKINYLILDGNRIDKISNKAFDLPPNNQTLRLFLRDNELNDNSFESGTFEQMNRVVILDLSKNNITYLKKSVFAPVFRRRRSFITLRSNPLICDCNFKWLYNRKLLYNSSNSDKHFVVGVQCNGTRHINEKINELTQTHFQHCPEEDTNDCFLNSVSDYDYELCVNSAKSSYLGHIPILLINTFIFYLLIR